MRATHMGMPDRLGAMGRECRRSPIPVILGRPMPVAAPDRLSAPASSNDRKGGFHLGTLDPWSVHGEPGRWTGLPAVLRRVACLVRPGREVPGLLGLASLARRVRLPWLRQPRGAVSYTH